MPPSVVFQDRTETPDAFFASCQRAAGALRALGIGEGDVVAMTMRNGPGALELMLAARWLGAYWCPINWHFLADEVRHILVDSGASLWIADADLLAALGDLSATGLAQLAARPPGRRHDPRADAEAAPHRSWEALRDAASPPAGTAAAPRGAMLYTSGTTGRPKGIRRQPSTPEQSALGLARLGAVVGLEPGMRALVSAPLYHSAPNSFVVGAALQEGATIVIEPRFDAERTLQLIERHCITHAYLVPTMYVRLLRLPDEVRRRYDLRSMRFVSSTGSPCPREVKRAMIEWWGPVIHEAYGSSELGYMTLLTSEQALRKPGSAGAPLPGVALRILDEQGRELPRGSPGLIYVSQPGLADFTYNANDASRKAMERDGFLTMGDIGYVDDEGYLYIVDRAADMVISGGVNIYPAEIEACLHGMPGVADCAVFGIPDPEFGESLAAAVQPAPGATLDAEQVRSWLRERIAGYKVPALVSLHAELPREDTGKIFKRKLREPYWRAAGRSI